jgi:hypothetical protein
MASAEATARGPAVLLGASADFTRRIEQFLSANREAFSGARVAVVVADDVGYAMTRMHEILSDVDALPMEICAFREWVAAERWLDGSSA